MDGHDPFFFHLNTFFSHLYMLHMSVRGLADVLNVCALHLILKVLCIVVNIASDHRTVKMSINLAELVLFISQCTKTDEESSFKWLHNPSL